MITMTLTTYSTTATRNPRGIFEDAWDRNYTFEEKRYIIGNVMYRKAAMIRAARLDRDDVYQELSLRMLQLLDAYDPERCCNLDAYLTEMLKYHLYSLNRGSKRAGMPEAPRYGVSMLSLNKENRFGHCLEIPAEDTDSSPEWVENEIDALPKKQRAVIDRLLSGARVSPQNKSLRAARLRLRNRLEERRLQYA